MDVGIRTLETMSKADRFNLRFNYLRRVRL